MMFEGIVYFTTIQLILFYQNILFRLINKLLKRKNQIPVSVQHFFRWYHLMQKDLKIL